MLLRSYNLKLLSSDRIRVPVEVARDLGRNFLGLETSADIPFVYLFTMDLWQMIEDKIRECGTLTPEVRADLLRTVYSSAFEVVLDKSRGIDIPPFMKDRGLGTRTTLLCVGRRAHLVDFRVWQDLRLGAISTETRSLLNALQVSSRVGRTFETERQAELVRRFFHDNWGAMLSRGDPRAFEVAVGEVLATSGVGIVEVTQPIKDEGVDIIVHIPRETEHDILYVQCKAGKRKVTVSEVRELIGVVARDAARAGLLVATAGFTPASESEASLSRFQIDLVEAAKLATWIEERLVSVMTQA